MKDKASAVDIVTAGISTEVTPPDYACPKCGKEMLDANTREMMAAGRKVRVCSAPACRAKGDWASGGCVLEAPVDAPN